MAGVVVPRAEPGGVSVEVAGEAVAPNIRGEWDVEIIICRDADEVGKVAGARIAHILRGSERPVMGVATGSSPVGTYADLARRVQEGKLDVSRLEAYALDEYLGLPPEHDQSYAYFLRKEFAERLGIDPARVHSPNGMAEDPVAAGEEYDQSIAAAGGIDVQILGIGPNGHIGFNEPGSSFASRTRMKTLTASTREANKRFFSSLDEVPTHCLTQGLGTIMDARNLVLVAQGAGKADAVAAAVEGPVSAMCPASILQFHRRVWMVIDEAAAAKLAHRDYYDHIRKSMPESQMIEA